jgi:RNA polymerase sigma factor (sigma-70 family)
LFVMSDVTRILSQIETGDPSAAEQLLPLVYDELRKLAAARLANEKPGQTLQATALVHEAYLRLVCNKEPTARSEEAVGKADLASISPSLAPAFDSRGHFFAAAAQAMQRILVESARRKQRHRHGGQLRRVELPDEGIAATPRDEELLLLDEALSRLAAIRPQATALVQLRYFAGQTVEEAAAIIGISERTARRLWVFAQAWLRREVETLDDGKSLADK